MRPAFCASPPWPRRRSASWPWHPDDRARAKAWRIVQADERVAGELRAFVAAVEHRFGRRGRHASGGRTSWRSYDGVHHGRADRRHRSERADRCCPCSSRGRERAADAAAWNVNGMSRRSRLSQKTRGFGRVDARSGEAARAPLSSTSWTACSTRSRSSPTITFGGQIGRLPPTEISERRSAHSTRSDKQRRSCWMGRSRI